MTTRHGLEIRAATPADAAGLADLLTTAGHPVPTQTLAARIDAIRQAPGTILLALEWGPPSGVIALTWFPTLGADRPTARITTLLVGANERRRGIGRLLLKAAAQVARVAGCATIEIAADPDSETLNAFCQDSGFILAAGCLIRGLRRQS